MVEQGNSRLQHQPLVPKEDECASFMSSPLVQRSRLEWRLPAWPVGSAGSFVETGTSEIPKIHQDYLRPGPSEICHAD